MVRCGKELRQELKKTDTIGRPASVNHHGVRHKSATFRVRHFAKAEIGWQPAPPAQGIEVMVVS
jgi:hypothetical protein